MTRQIKADLSLLGMTAIWGLSFPLMKNVLEHIPSFPYLSLRFLIATLVLVILFFGRLRKINGRTAIVGCLIGFLMFGGMALQVCGLYYTSASNSAFITGMNVVFVPIVSSLLLRKKPDISSVFGVILAFGGLFFLTGGLDFNFNLGDLLTLLCAICWTFQIIYIDKYTNEMDPVLLCILQIAFSTLLYFGVWGGINPGPITLDSTVMVVLLVTGVLGTALAFAVQTSVQRFTSPTHTALILTAEPVFGALFAATIPNSAGVTETLKLHTLAGCLLILGGMLICELKVVEKLSGRLHKAQG